jgi:hypothetical protein
MKSITIPNSHRSAFRSQTDQLTKDNNPRRRRLFLLVFLCLSAGLVPALPAAPITVLLIGGASES